VKEARVKAIDINADLGEGFGAWSMGDDEAMLRVVSSANIACGFHAGDPGSIRRTTSRAAVLGVAMGAHPSLPDLVGFGRRAMAVTAGEVYDMVLYQIAALAAFARLAGSMLRHVKPHGALYNMAAVDLALACAIADAVRDFDPRLMLYGLAGSRLLEAGCQAGLTVVSEVFADRGYRSDGTLVPRSEQGALLHDPVQVSARAVAMVRDGGVESVEGVWVPLDAQTICVHGDSPGAVGLALALRAALVSAGFAVLAPGA
jgi:UPF0271 protein